MKLQKRITEIVSKVPFGDITEDYTIESTIAIAELIKIIEAQNNQAFVQERELESATCLYEVAKEEIKTMLDSEEEAYKKGDFKMVSTGYHCNSW